jgi:hypothetical protein
MGILALAADERVADVEISDDELSVQLRDGRRIIVPLVWYPRLLQATDEQRKNWKVSGGGYGIHWEEIDEDLSSEGLLRGAPAARSSIFAAETQRKVMTSLAPESQAEAAKATSVEDRKKGILDHVIEGVDAAKELEEVMLWIGSETDKFTTKISKHTENLDRLSKNLRPSTTKDVQRLLLLAVSDMNTFSQRVEERLPRLERCTQVLDDSYSFYVKVSDPESTVDKDRIRTLGKEVETMLEALKPAKESIANFRDSTVLIRDQNISGELTKAAERQFRALDDLLSETVRLESFALNISFLVEEWLKNMA